MMANEPKHVAEFLILITNICCVYWLNKLLYYCKTQRVAPIKNDSVCFHVMNWLKKLLYYCKTQRVAPIKNDSVCFHVMNWLKKLLYYCKTRRVAPIKNDSVCFHVMNWLKKLLYYCKTRRVAPIKNDSVGFHVISHPSLQSCQAAKFWLNLLKPNDIYICHIAALTSRRYILNIYSTNIHIEYFKHAA